MDQFRFNGEFYSDRCKTHEAYNIQGSRVGWREPAVDQDSKHHIGILRAGYYQVLFGAGLGWLFLTRLINGWVWIDMFNLTYTGVGFPLTLYVPHAGNIAESDPKPFWSHSLSPLHEILSDGCWLSKAISGEGPLKIYTDSGWMLGRSEAKLARYYLEIIVWV